MKKFITLSLTVPVLLAATTFSTEAKEFPPVGDDVIQKITEAAPAKAPAKAMKPRKVLVFYRTEGFVHGSIPVANKAMEILGQKAGAYTTVVSDDMAMFAPDTLRQFDAVIFNNTTGLKFENPEHRQALMDFVKGGKGVVGIHAASDNFPTWPEAQEMMGGCFDGHPWGGGGTWAVKIDDPKNPINKSFDGQDFKIKDEIYQIKGAYSREKFRELLSLDMSDSATGGVGGQKRADKDNAIAWIHPVGKGRVFYCSLGHNNEVFWNAPVLAHYLAGIQYALGDLKCDDSPSQK